MAQTSRASPDRSGPDRRGPDRRGQGANAQQLRDDIDKGRTRDKVDHPDPATAPLGTDAEAGGARASVQPPWTERQPPAPARSRRFAAPRAKTARPWLLALLVAIVVNAGLVWLFAVWFFAAP